MQKKKSDNAYNWLDVRFMILSRTCSIEYITIIRTQMVRHWGHPIKM